MPGVFNLASGGGAYFNATELLAKEATGDIVATRVYRSGNSQQTEVVGPCRAMGVVDIRPASGVAYLRLENAAGDELYFGGAGETGFGPLLQTAIMSPSDPDIDAKFVFDIRLEAGESLYTRTYNGSVSLDMWRIDD
jgi:hypothetical protein